MFGKGCIDGTYNVKQALHTLSQHGADSYVIFADLVKAYDTVDRELLWKIMARYGCPEELIFVLRKLYTNITVQLKGFGKGFTIPSTVGVKQISPRLEAAQDHRALPYRQLATYR